MSDLIGDLRLFARVYVGHGEPKEMIATHITWRAADRIESLQRENAALVAQVQEAIAYGEECREAWDGGGEIIGCHRVFSRILSEYKGGYRE